MRQLVYIAAAAGILGAGGLAYSQLGRPSAPAPRAANSQAVGTGQKPKPIPAQEAKLDPIAGALASSPPPPPAAKPVVEPLRPPASIPKPKVATKPKPKAKPKAAVLPKKVV